MEKRAKNQQQETQGKTTSSIINKDEKQTNTKELVSPKTGILDQTRRRPRRLDEDVRKLSIEFMVIKV